MTIDLDTTDVEVYGRRKRGVALNHQGQRVGRPHVATWAETATVLAADLMAGNEDPRRARRRAAAPGAGRRCPPPARAGRIRLRADAGYFAGQLARAALFAEVEFAIGARRIAPLWRLLDGVAETDWTDAIDMPGAQVAVADYCPDWWPASDPAADPPGPPRRRPPGRSPPIRGPGGAAPCTPTSAPCRSTSWPTLDAVYGYSFIVTNLDVSTGEQAAAVEHWYRHRTQIENIFRDAKHGAALRHLPSGYPEVNTAWMWGALLAASIAGWLHQLTATPGTRRRSWPGTASAAAKP